MKQQLERIRQDALQELEAAKEQLSLENLRVKYLGKKGELTAILKQMGKLSRRGASGNRTISQRGSFQY